MVDDYATVIEIIIILAIVIALGIFFKDQIIDLANSIWNSISGNEANVTNFDKLKSGGRVPGAIRGASGGGE
ncbi:MAG: Flp1 family type IVb pilin [Clostridium sp.]